MYTFASDEIFNKIFEKHTASLPARATEIFNAGVATQTYGGISAGHLFEKICLWLKPLKGKSVEATNLSNGSTFEFVVPEARDMLPFDWQIDGNLPVDVLLSPRICNLESGNQFYLATMNGKADKLMLVVLQMTVGEMHPVNSNGLHVIFNAFSKELQNRIDKKVILFVIPNFGKLCTEQKITTNKGEDMNSNSIPRAVSDFEQYVYRYKLI